MNRILAAALPAIALSAPFAAASCDITTNPVSPSGINAPGSLTFLLDGAQSCRGDRAMSKWLNGTPNAGMVNV